MDGWLLRRRKRMELTDKSLPGTWGDASNLAGQYKKSLVIIFRIL